MGLRWQEGRQGTGYRKLLLAEGKRWDLYVLDYPAGTTIPTHVDPVPGQRHWRANLVVWGEQAFEGAAWLRAGPLVVFRPDVTPHRVNRVARRRLVLSFGWVTAEDASPSRGPGRPTGSPSPSPTAPS